MAADPVPNLVCWGRRGASLRTVVQLSLGFLLAACLTTTAEDGGTDACKNQPDGTDCATGLCCGQVCSTFQTDALNCGACGLACPNSESCAGGVCLDCALLGDGTSCNAGAYDGLCCSGACIDVLTDPNNCGGCGFNGDAGPPAVCSIGDLCVDAGCVAQCVGAGNNTPCSIVTVNDGNCCGQLCTNPETDNNNCYLCGLACTGGKTCMQSVCQ